LVISEFLDKRKDSPQIGLQYFPGHFIAKVV